MSTKHSETLSSLRKTFFSGKTKDIDFRKNQLKALFRFLSENESLIVSALSEDLRKPPFETRLAELENVYNDIRGQLFNLDQYVSHKSVAKSLVTIADDAFIHSEPYGLVLIISAWNYPIMVTIGPLVGAIAAGIHQKCYKTFD